MVGTNDNSYRKALHSALRILARRDHSMAELNRKLHRCGHSQEVIRHVVNECLQRNYLNDDRAAAQVIDSLFRKGWGIHRIRNELLKRGLAGENSEAILREKLSPAEEQATARQVFLKKWKALEKESDPQKKKLRMQRFLRSRGFSDSVIIDVMEEMAFGIQKESFS
jgi:regulatory protein